MILRNFQQLHEDGRQLVLSWVDRANKRASEEDPFESFIYCWIAFNAWGTCVTGIEQDGLQMRELRRDKSLNEIFSHLLSEDEPFKLAALEFRQYWPIFKVQALRNAAIQTGSERDRRIVVSSLAADTRRRGWWAPEDPNNPHAVGENFVLTWDNTLSAIYRVRCNLFHGGKSVRVPLDRKVVALSLQVLLPFFIYVLSLDRRRTSTGNL